jgi:putative hydrolase of the HAD superfamily
MRGSIPKPELQVARAPGYRRNVPSSPSPEAVVFDLGGVLAGFHGVDPMKALARIDDDEEMWRRWLTCEWVRRFERGHCTAAEFAAGVVADWELTITAEAFLDEFATWVIDPYAEADDLVASTAERATVACLSNMNSVHWERGVSDWPLIARLDRAFLSFQIGLVKPDPEVYGHVVAALGTAPERVLFLDDNQINVDAAREAGLRAERVRGIPEAAAAVQAAFG